ncbi:isochorismatase family protein [Pelagibaculum spongiae]|uniref:Uncharacterized protein n=1 Tax=Pelagibaculum spongiae TaxID=2080658 RepID=A0A2V1H070_9GAMM|nr:isochorismatase family protein [Pelagibaculum spongiae]PVZ72069.1 hypothetical protein DC094_03345 [Pelagibaculum spongiae]
MQQLESQTAIITGFSTDCCVFDTAKDLISAGKNVVISEEVTTRNVFLGKKKFPEGIDNFNSLQSEHTDRVELVRIIKLPESRKS